MGMPVAVLEGLAADFDGDTLIKLGLYSGDTISKSSWIAGRLSLYIDMLISSEASIWGTFNDYPWNGSRAQVSSKWEALHLFSINEDVDIVWPTWKHVEVHKRTARINDPCEHS